METILWEQESDNYTKRAINTLSNKIYSDTDSLLCKNIKEYSSKTKNILDIGCAYGRTINNLRKKFHNSKLYGIDPGEKTIKIAKKNINFPNIKFRTGFSHKLPFKDKKFDVVILSMVLQWLPRKYIIKTISEIDRVLKDGGIIYIQEFLGNKPIASKSIHNKKVFIFKDNYSSYFIGFPWYREIYRKVIQISEGEDQQRNISIIRKYNHSEVYTLKKAVKEKNEK